MNFSEFTETYNLILNDAAAIAHNQQVLAGIHTQLNYNSFNPFEQDIIYEDHFGQIPSEPREFTHRGVTITSRILHQTGVGLRDIVGADLLYEITSEKFGLIQYKRANNGSVKNDVSQLEVLLNNCPDVCSNKKKRPIPLDWIPLRLNSFCGSWYCVFDGTERRYVHACEAEAVFNGRGSTRSHYFKTGLTKESFMELFSSCRIGALLRRYPDPIIRPDAYTSWLLEQRHVILEVQQQGRWSEE